MRPSGWLASHNQLPPLKNGCNIARGGSPPAAETVCSPAVGMIPVRKRISVPSGAQAARRKTSAAARDRLMRARQTVRPVPLGAKDNAATIRRPAGLSVSCRRAGELDGLSTGYWLYPDIEVAGLIRSERDRMVVGRPSRVGLKTALKRQSRQIAYDHPTGRHARGRTPFVLRSRRPPPRSCG
jgi:hypothetical protein